jgi:hypothetical protein
MRKANVGAESAGTSCIAPPSAGFGGGDADELDGTVLLDLLLRLLGREKGGEEQPQHERGDGQKRYCRENLAEMEGHAVKRVLTR